MKNLKYILFGVLFTVITVSCDKGFEDVNTNPNSPVAVPSSNLITNIVFNAGNQLYTWSLAGDMGECWIQHWSKVQYNDEERYIVRQSVVQSFWDVFYASVLSDAVSMETIAKAEGNKVNVGVSLVLQAYALSLLTDAYGDVPNTEAIGANVGNFTPVYDAQSVVYDSILSKLDRANALIASGVGEVNPNFDILYNGDASGWRKFANSLKIRSLMRISAKRDVSAELTAALARPIFTSADDEAKLIYLSEQPNANPMYETVIFGGRKEWKVSDVWVNTLSGLNDPRLAVTANTNSAGDYRGKPVGLVDVPSEDYNYDNVSQLGDFYLEATAPAYFMSYTELQFLLADAAQDGLISGNAADYYAAGIKASMADNGIVAGVDAYVASVPYSADNLGTQKWIALFGQGFEAWTEWRRTGLPVLSPALEAIEDQIPTRYNYPKAEQTTNNANYTSAVQQFGGVQGDLLFAKVWWMN